MTLGLFSAAGGRDLNFGGDPHAHLKRTDEDVIGGQESNRERMWAIRRGSDDYHAFVAGSGAGGNRGTSHYTSSDGISWSLDSNSPVAGNSNHGTQDMCVFTTPDTDKRILLAEDSSTTPSNSDIWTADSLDASSWTRADEFTTKFGNSEQYGVANTTPWYDGTDLWLFIEEYHSSSEEYTLAIKNSGDPTVASDYVNQGRIFDRANHVPKGMFEINGNPRLYTLFRNGSTRQYKYAKPVGGDLSNWELVADVYARPPYNERAELMPLHDSNGWNEYYPEGKDRPWVYSWHANGLGGDNSYDLLRGQGTPP